MKIKFIKEPCGIGFAYSTGNEADLPESAALELIADGYAEAVENEPVTEEHSKPVAKPSKKK
jgi:hypothetical protein